jgi:hypothetical protein
MKLKGISSQNRLDPKQFFEELATRGVKTPAGFDPEKFWAELATRGIAMPDDMVSMKKN